MRHKALVGLGLAFSLLAGPALADEIVYFTNGTTMAIASHEIEDDTITVELDAGSTMAFPLKMVDRIEVAGVDVLKPDSGPANRMIGGTAVSGVMPSRLRRGAGGPKADRTRNSRVSTNESGMDTFRPQNDSSHPAKRDVRVTAHQAITGAQNDPERSKSRIDTTQRRGSGPLIRGIERRDAPKPPKKADSE